MNDTSPALRSATVSAAALYFHSRSLAPSHVIPAATVSAPLLSLLGRLIRNNGKQWLNLFGIDLFNAGYYWESHVAWESLWLAAGRQGPVADLLKGLIKLAAAGVKALEGKPEGVKSHSGRAAELWRAVSLAQPNIFLGFDVRQLTILADDIHQHGWQVRPLLKPALE